MTTRCPIMSQVSDEQCREADGHPQCSPSRFHRFAGPLAMVDEKRAAHVAWHAHLSDCAECRGGEDMCTEAVMLMDAMEALGCTFKSWCVLRDGHDGACDPADPGAPRCRKCLEWPCACALASQPQGPGDGNG